MQFRLSTIRWRSGLARVKAVLDVYVLATQPRFYGPRVEIKFAQTASPQPST